MFGWILNLITRFSNGSSELTLFTDKSLYFGIFNLATILERKLFQISNISLLLPRISFFFNKCDFLFDWTLIREKEFNCFLKQFVIGDIPIIKTVVIFPTIPLRFTYLRPSSFSDNYKPIYFLQVFFQSYSRITGLQEKGEDISLTRH